MARRCAGLGASVRRLCVVSRGVGRVGQWEHGGNCTTRRFDTPATRRWEASCSAKPPFGPPGAPSMAGWRLWRDEAWGGLGGCSSFQRPGYGSTGGIALQGGSTRRRRAVGRLGVVQNPLVESQSVALRANDTGQPREVAGLPGQRSCAACDCTDAVVMAAFGSEAHETAGLQQNQTVSITFVARRSSIAA